MNSICPRSTAAITSPLPRKKTWPKTSRGVLYPDDSSAAGRELRLRQEYFFCSASLQDLVGRFFATHSDVEQLPAHVAIHLNDTHPVLAIPELMRILIDEHGLPFAQAWPITQQVFSYTNHTLMQEALETWPVGLFDTVLPRLLQIIFDINTAFITDIGNRFGPDFDLMRRVSIIDEDHGQRVRMAYLAVVASHKINGVSALHSDLMTQSIFADFYQVFPDRFTKYDQRHHAAALAVAGESGVVFPHRPSDRYDVARAPGSAGRPETAGRRPRVCRRNSGLPNWSTSSAWPTGCRRTWASRSTRRSLFDVHVKRIHEYKRQLLNVLHVITRYQRILANPDADWVPRTVVFAGKAASAYHMAKQIIHLINDVAATINNDARVGDKLKVVFLPNYNVSLAEIIMPAADLSEQISTAGTEASGTGNMKLALNGALTIGTLDGANVEMRESVGADNIFIFGNTTEEVAAIRANGYQPQALCDEQSRTESSAGHAARRGVFTGRCGALPRHPRCVAGMGRPLSAAGRLCELCGHAGPGRCNLPNSRMRGRARLF